MLILNFIKIANEIKSTLNQKYNNNPRVLEILDEILKHPTGCQVGNQIGNELNIDAEQETKSETKNYS